LDSRFYYQKKYGGYMNNIASKEISKIKSNAKTIGKKLVSALQQPLFTISFQAVTTKPVVEKKTDEPKRLPPKKTVTAHNVLPKRKEFAKIFTPIRDKEEFEKILFVLRACDKNGGNEFTKVLHIEQTNAGSRLIATDGKRMHVTEIRTRIRPGDYKPVIAQNIIRMGKPVPNVHFPNWERVVPSNIIQRGCINIENTAIGERSPVYNSFVKQTGEKVNPKFLADLTKKPWVVYCQREKRKALLLKERNAKTKTYAVIMPLSA
jgi:hypothetical protein